MFPLLVNVAGVGSASELVSKLANVIQIFRGPDSKFTMI